MLDAAGRILVFHHGALGDGVLLWPLLRGFAEPVTLIAPGERGQLAQSCLPQVQTYDANAACWSTLFAPGIPSPVDHSVNQLLARAQLILSFVSNGHDAWAAHVRQHAPQAQLVCIAPRPPGDYRQHVCAWHAEQLAAQGVAVNWRDPELRWQPDGPILLHPGSGGRAKCWPAARWVQLQTALQQRGLPVRCVLGEVELERWSAAERAQLQAVVCPTLVDLQAQLRTARAFIGNDSGPAQLAAQLGLPTLALFGPSNPQQWRPRGPRVFTLAPAAPQPMTWLTSATVLALVDPLLHAVA